MVKTLMREKTESYLIIHQNLINTTAFTNLNPEGLPLATKHPGSNNTK